MAMKHVYTKSFEYENFSGLKKRALVHFHLTGREFVDWMTKNMDTAKDLYLQLSGLEGKDPKKSMTMDDLASTLNLVKTICEISYGVPSEDGDYFDKRGVDKFLQSAAYDAFREMLFQEPGELEKFLSTVINPEVLKALSKMDFGAGAIEAQVQDEVKEKALTELSREELLAKFQERSKA